MAQPLFDDDPSHNSAALSSHNPLHVLHHRVFIYERRTSDGWVIAPEYPYSYHLVREWDCDCTASVYKKKTLHIVQLDSPLKHPDYRIYRCLRRLEPAGPMEPPHAQAYRETFDRDGVILLYAQFQHGIDVLQN
jgi:hypothetical protein